MCLCLVCVCVLPMSCDSPHRNILRTSVAVFATLNRKCHFMYCIHEMRTNWKLNEIERARDGVGGGGKNREL